MAWWWRLALVGALGWGCDSDFRSIRTLPDAPPPAAPALGPTAGGGRTAGQAYALDVVVGEPEALQRTASDRYRLTLGLGPTRGR